ncbi:MAG: hypothetical protein HC786_15935 [Richelia sp. CSU_2_1]|nr:hypothetical protein [Microcoleus sp. SU_5_6]NJR23541.1 hypothetical protein [Richelia sp. CSU_2_1]
MGSTKRTLRNSWSNTNIFFGWVSCFNPTYIYYYFSPFDIGDKPLPTTNYQLPITNYQLLSTLQ